MKNEILTACYQFVGAAVNGTYQGILITVLVAASLRMLRRTNAATRYAVWFGTLLLLALIIPAHCLRNRWDTGDRLATVQTPVSARASLPESEDMRMEASSLPGNFGGESEYSRLTFRMLILSRTTVQFDASEQQYPDLASDAGTNRQSSEDPAHAIVLALLDACRLKSGRPESRGGIFRGHQTRAALAWRTAHNAFFPLENCSNSTSFRRDTAPDNLAGDRSRKSLVSHLATFPHSQIEVELC